MFQEQERVSVEIKTSRLRFQAEVQCVRERFLVLACPPADVLRCPEGTPVCVSQAAAGLLYRFDAEVARSQANNIIVPRVTPQIIQRRQAARIICDLEGCYTLLMSRSLGSKPVKETEQQLRVCNISVGGAFGYVEEATFSNIPMRLRVCLESGEWITIEAVALRCGPRAPGDPRAPGYPYEACFRFTSLGRSERLALTRMVQNGIKAGRLISPA